MPATRHNHAHNGHNGLASRSSAHAPAVAEAVSEIDGCKSPPVVAPSSPSPRGSQAPDPHDPHEPHDPHAPASSTTAVPPLSPEQETELIVDYLNPNIDTAQLARDHNLTIAQFLAWLASPRIQQQLDDLEQASMQRAKRCAANVQPKAVAALEHIIAAYNDAEINEDPGRNPVSLNIRQRHRESARRAAWLILRISGAIPVHLRAARPTPGRAEPTDSDSAAHRPNRSCSSCPGPAATTEDSALPPTLPADPALAPTDELPFARRERTARAMRENDAERLTDEADTAHTDPDRHPRSETPPSRIQNPRSKIENHTPRPPPNTG